MNIWHVQHRLLTEQLEGFLHCDMDEITDDDVARLVCAAYVLTRQHSVVGDLDHNGEDVALVFDEPTISHLLQAEPLMSPDALAGLSLAWRHRKQLLKT